MKRREFVKLIGASGTSLPFGLSHSPPAVSATLPGVAVITPADASKNSYDVVVVGSGVAGALAAKRLSANGKRVLIVEAGTAEGLSAEGFNAFVENFHAATNKHSNAPYPANENALSPSDGLNGYFVESGPLPISGSYTRIVGGTTMHWEGKTLRMFPSDFKPYTQFGHGLDWPLSYDDLQSDYSDAEREIGVAGDVEEQRALGIPFPKGYLYPMKRIPPSYLDEQLRKRIDGSTMELEGEQIALKLSTFPQARNSEANPGYAMTGIPCQGSASCVPICPMQAKYDARRTLLGLDGKLVHLLPQCVVSRVNVDPHSRRVASVTYKHYRSVSDSSYQVNSVSARVFVLACNAVENARLLLSSEVANSSGLVGCYLMDHPFLLAWGLMPEPAGVTRGPLVTSGIAGFRDGNLRKKQAAFSIDIHNDGWGWAGVAVADIMRELIDRQNAYGSSLRAGLADRVSRQLLLAFMCEMPADRSNRVTVDSRSVDRLGNMRPVMHYNLPEYSKKAIASARNVSKFIFGKAGVEDHTEYKKADPAYFEYGGTGYWFRGGNHFSGTHVMGTSKQNSVVDSNLRSWDHENLYLLGSGAMPSIGTANTTLSIAALSFRAARQMARDLGA
jgi:choline dehydrogenase-like flavoprotein